MRKPTFFILGAPKCGTTALTHWLREHPQVYISPRKEPHFFNVDGLVSTTTLRQYQALYADADDHHRAVGEASTHYLYSGVAVKRILNYQPAAVFIVCLRNPIEMAPSLHRELMKQGQETERSFEEAWRLQTTRATGHHLPRTIRRDPARVQYGRYCKLGEQLERLLQTAGPHRVLPLLLEDMRTDPGCQYRRVLAFLGIDDDGRQRFDVINPSRHTRSTRIALLAREASDLKRRLGWTRPIGVMHLLARLNTRVASRESLIEPLRTELAQFFGEDVNRLASLLGRDLSTWLKVGQAAGQDSASAGIPA